MTKWLSDETIDTRSVVTQENLPPFADISPIMEVFDQAREANRLRERVAELERTFKHYHESLEGRYRRTGSDACARCSLDLRDPIHHRVRG